MFRLADVNRHTSVADATSICLKTIRAIQLITRQPVLVSPEPNCRALDARIP